MKMKLWVANFNMNDNKLEEINFRELLTEEACDQIDRMALNAGLVVEIKAIIDAERFLGHYFTVNKYRHTRGKIYNNGERFNPAEFPVKDLEQLEVLNTAVHEVGCPDLLVWNDKEWFFVECKRGADSLRREQILWLCKYKFPMKVIFCDGDGPWDSKWIDRDYCLTKPSKAKPTTSTTQ